jgi:hypothetical protein
MDTDPGTLTVWQSGRLAPRLAARRFEFQWGRAQSLGAALLALSAVVLAAFVGVVQRDVERGELVHAAQRARSVDAACAQDQPAEQGGRCPAPYEGDTPATAADNTARTALAAAR